MGDRKNSRARLFQIAQNVSRETRGGDTVLPFLYLPISLDAAVKIVKSNPSSDQLLFSFTGFYL